MALTQTKKGARLDHSFSDLIDAAVQPSVTEVTEETAAPARKPAQVPEAAPAAVEQPKPKARRKLTPKASEPRPVDLSGSDLDSVLTSLQSDRGVQKSIYIEADIHQYILDKCDTTGAKYSQVVNLLLRSAIAKLS